MRHVEGLFVCVHNGLAGSEPECDVEEDSKAVFGFKEKTQQNP